MLFELWFWILIIVKMTPDLFFSDITRESFAAQTDHYVDDFVCQNVARVLTL